VRSSASTSRQRPWRTSPYRTAPPKSSAPRREPGGGAPRPAAVRLSFFPHHDYPILHHPAQLRLGERTPLRGPGVAVFTWTGCALDVDLGSGGAECYEADDAGSGAAAHLKLHDALEGRRSRAAEAAELVETAQKRADAARVAAARAAKAAPEGGSASASAPPLPPPPPPPPPQPH